MRDVVRREARKVTRAFSSEYVSSASSVIENRLFEYLDANFDMTSEDTRVFVYNSYGTEVDTHNVIRRLVDSGVSVYLPIVRGNIIEAVKVERDSDFVEGDYGIMEPVGKIYDGVFDISITPLLAYDRSLNRMGKGMGYYDRFFAGHIVGCIIGLAFKKQEFSNVYAEPHDVKMNVIINEKELLCE